MFKRKRKKTGCKTPEYRQPGLPPNPNLGWQPTKSSGTKPLKPPTSGSSVFKPSPVAVLPNDISTVEIMCHYETPCGWCCKWDKKCDKKIGGYPTISDKIQKKTVFETPNTSPCSNCIENTKIFSLCAECGGSPNYKLFKSKEN